MPAGMPAGRGQNANDMQEAEGNPMIMQMQQAVMKQVFANRCNSFKQECKAKTTFHAVKDAEDYSIPATSHTEEIRYLRDSSGRTILK